MTTNKRRRDIHFQPGDEVVVRAIFVPSIAFKHIPVKIQHWYIKPFKVVKAVSLVAYALQLPSNKRIHPTFHIKKLKKFEHSEEFERNISSPPESLEVEGEQEFEVEAIIKHRGSTSKRQYLVAWKGYELHEATWEPEANLTHCSDLVAEYLLRLQRQEAIKKTRQNRRKK